MDYDITLPVADDEAGYQKLIYVKPDSKISCKNALELIATYFQREFRYSHLQYATTDSNDDCIGVLFSKAAYDLVNSEFHYPNRIIGGACFRGIHGNYKLDWIWFHPYERNQGYLKSHWKEFKAKFGEFELSKPISAPMKAFLEKHNC